MALPQYPRIKGQWLRFDACILDLRLKRSWPSDRPREQTLKSQEKPVLPSLRTRKSLCVMAPARYPSQLLRGLRKKILNLRTV